MSWRDYASTTAKYPRDAMMINRLRKLIERAHGDEYTFAHLLTLLRPSSPENLALILDDLERQGLVKRVFRVESPQKGGGLGDFASIADVPSQILDIYTDQEIDVEPKFIRPIFKIA